MVASNQELKAMISRFARYIKRKKLELSSDKVMVFERRGGEKARRKWILEKNEIEEIVKEMSYLGYIF